MTYEEALAYIHHVSRLGSRPGLSRVRELCALAGDPQKKLSFVHVAGTNGKGSFCSMLSSVLTASGRRVGTFTSPYVYRFNERMAVDGEPIGDGELANIIEKLQPLAESMEDTPTEFELLTVAGFEFFLSRGCDIVVLETGLGGRLDSTNIIESPLLSVITGIDYDHTALLGDTLEKIAAEKAGIIKAGRPVLCAHIAEGPAGVIKEKALLSESECIFINNSDLSKINCTLDGCSFKASGYEKPFEISLCGVYQPENALLVIRAAELIGIDETSIRKGLSAARWRARFEVISRNPTVIFDGGHNPQGVAAAVASARAVYGGQYAVLTGVMTDKDYTDMAAAVSEIAGAVFCTVPDNPRALDSDALACCYRNFGVYAESVPTVFDAVRHALEYAKEKEMPLLCLGSLYMYRQVRDALTDLLGV